MLWAQHDDLSLVEVPPAVARLGAGSEVRDHALRANEHPVVLAARIEVNGAIGAATVIPAAGLVEGGDAEIKREIMEELTRDRTALAARAAHADAKGAQALLRHVDGKSMAK